MFALATWTPAQAHTSTLKCYDAWFDADGDGHATKGTLPTLLELDAGAMHCPVGYRDYADDCDDSRASVHPGRTEVGYNGRDDNCNDMIDEPVFLYSAAGADNGYGRFTVRVKLNHTQIRNAAIADTLYVKLRYFQLVDEDGTLHTTNYVHLTHFDASHLEAHHEFDAFSSGTMYAARLFFYRLEANGTYTDIGPNNADGLDMERYYTMTDSPNDSVHRRFLIVMKGLAEYSASEKGEVGYLGTLAVDGTRYGADRGENWCSEFYVWATQDQLDGVRGIDDAEHLMDFFDDQAPGALYAPTAIPLADPGDYLPIDGDQDGDVSHSAMLLAYDSHKNTVWTLEGNAGNRVKVKSKAGDWNAPLPAGKRGPYFMKVGMIRSRMWQ
jgi:hypothetical protein